VAGATLSGGMMTGSERLMVVANRLPVTCIRDPGGAGWQLQVVLVVCLIPVMVIQSHG
jgi:hypothetical protein